MQTNPRNRKVPVIVNINRSGVKAFELPKNNSFSLLKKLLLCLLMILFVIFIWQSFEYLLPQYTQIRYTTVDNDHYNYDNTFNTTVHIEITNTKSVTYPRLNTSANVNGLPASLRTHKFCGYNRDCKQEALCHCPINKSLESKYAKIEFPSNIYDYGWQKYYNIGYPPKFNTSFIENNSIPRVRQAWNLYKDRTSSGQCEGGGGMWASWTKPGYHKCTARIVGEKLNFKPGMKVLDMGSGCGHTIAQWAYWFGIFGMGFDFQLLNVLNANKIATQNNLTYYTYHAAIQSIYSDNWIPNQSFDVVFSKAVLMYLNGEVCCQVLRKSIEILKIGGYAWFAWNDNVAVLKACIEKHYTNGNNTLTTTIRHYSLTEAEFLDTCSKNIPRDSLIIQRLT